ncbi:hypothetical protein AALP_AAs65108U000100, partial [Arabis alpina]
PFYTAFLSLLFWSGHGRLARQIDSVDRIL